MKTKTFELISPIHKAGRQISVYLSNKLSHFDATPGELHLLNYLRLFGPCPVNELIRVFGYKNTTMTSILDRLEKKSYITRSLNPDDRRSFMVKTTSDGNRKAIKSYKIVEDFDNTIISNISKSDLRGFSNVMKAISVVSDIELRQKALSIST